MKLFLTESSGWELPDGSPVNRQALSALGLYDGMPFFLNEDGSYADALNRWLRDLPGDGAAARSTWVNYARDVHVFLRFLNHARPGVQWTEVTTDDLHRYAKERREDPTSDLYVSGASWNRALAALERLYDWAVRTKLIAESPFTYRFRTLYRETRDTIEPVDSRQNVLRARPDRAPPRYLSVDEYVFFRNVGLRGLLPSGKADPFFRGRCAVRNALFSDLLVTTGMRRTEASTLLLWEIPEIAARAVPREVECTVEGAVSKNKQSRTVYVPREVYLRLQHYIREQRSHAVLGAIERHGGKAAADEALVAQHVEGTTVRLIGRKKPMDSGRFGVEDRVRLLQVAGDRVIGPAQVFVGESGLALAPTAWNDIFDAASARVERFKDDYPHATSARPGGDLAVRPHDLRHTYAVNFLSRLYQRFLETTDPAILKDAGRQLQHRLLKDPLRTLQLRMGHRQLESTFIYLQYIEQVQDLAHDAAAKWASDLDLSEGGPL